MLPRMGKVLIARFPRQVVLVGVRNPTKRWDRSVRRACSSRRRITAPHLPRRRKGREDSHGDEDSPDGMQPADFCRADESFFGGVADKCIVRHRCISFLDVQKAFLARSRALWT